MSLGAGSELRRVKEERFAHPIGAQICPVWRPDLGSQLTTGIQLRPAYIGCAVTVPC
jgi:hypothetical protein